MIAVTGATGLLGKHIVDQLVMEGKPVRVLCRKNPGISFPPSVEIATADVADQVSLMEAFEGVSAVIHSAAFVSFNPRRRKKIFETNVGGTRHVVDTCLELGIRDLVHVSSVSSLGRVAGSVITEESKWTGVSSSDYAESKYLAELEAFRGAEEGLRVSMINPVVILAASQPARSSAALFDYVWKGNSFYTEGMLNYVDARDVAMAAVTLCNNPRPGEKYILCAGQVSYQEFFSRVAKRFGKKAPDVRVPNLLGYWAGWAEELRSRVLNREPVVTRQSAHMAVQSFQYENSKAQDQLQLKYRNLDDTLDWCCGEYVLNVNANK